MAVSEEDLISEFEMFDLAIENEDTIVKLKEMCQVFRLSAENLAAEWIAFSHNKKINAMTMEALDMLERERLCRKNMKAAKSASKDKQSATTPILGIAPVDNKEDDLLGAYSTPNRKIKKRALTTPENPINKRLINQDGSPALPFSPASLSPSVVTPAKKFGARTNRGDVVFTYGKNAGVRWRTGRYESCTVNRLNSHSALTKQFKFMFQKLEDKAAVLDDMIDEMSKRIKEYHGIEEYVNPSQPYQTPVSAVGRLFCDSNGKLNSKSVMLEGSRDECGGDSVMLDLSEAKHYSFFPGQIVAVDGTNPSNSKFCVQNVHKGVPLPLSNCKTSIQNDGLRVVMAAGPFTTTDVMSYEPLTDLIKLLQKEPPDVIILMGPFIDIKHPNIESFDKGKYSDFLKSLITDLLTGFANLPTQIIVLPSYRDIHCPPVYPQPPFSEKIFDLNVDKKNVHFMSDPCMIEIDDVIFGITSTDILFHLGMEEISYPPGSSDRLGRLASHILTQHNFYPLHPPNEDVNIDYEKFELYAKMEVTPHVLILPSDLKYFVKEVNDCMCVNPGRLTKSQVGGTFCKMLIRPPTGEYENKPLTQTTTMEIVRI